MSIIKYGKDIPTFVRRFREDYELTQASLGKMLGVDGQYVSNVERGVNNSFPGFCSRLLTVLPADRKPYLMDLVAESGANRAIAKIRKKKRGAG